MSKFNFNIDNIENNENVNSLSKSKYNSITLKKLIEFNKYIVDLGLSSGTLWCKYNLGVDPNKLSKARDLYDEYYAWGEIEPKKKYNWGTYQFDEDLIKYNTEDHLTKLQFMDDAAYLNMHLYNFKFHMPTKELFEELIDETDNEWVEDFNGSGVNGYKFTSKLDSSKHIFLPSAGYCNGSNLDYISIVGGCWSSSLSNDNPYDAWYLYFDDRGVSIHNDSRCYGFNVRPVLNL